MFGNRSRVSSNVTGVHQRIHAHPLQKKDNFVQVDRKSNNFRKLHQCNLLKSPAEKKFEPVPNMIKEVKFVEFGGNDLGKESLTGTFTEQNIEHNFYKTNDFRKTEFMKNFKLPMPDLLRQCKNNLVINNPLLRGSNVTRSTQNIQQGPHLRPLKPMTRPHSSSMSSKKTDSRLSGASKNQKNSKFATGEKRIKTEKVENSSTPSLNGYCMVQKPLPPVIVEYVNRSKRFIKLFERTLCINVDPQKYVKKYGDGLLNTDELFEIAYKLGIPSETLFL